MCSQSALQIKRLSDLHTSHFPLESWCTSSLIKIVFFSGRNYGRRPFQISPISDLSYGMFHQELCQQESNADGPCGRSHLLPVISAWFCFAGELCRSRPTVVTNASQRLGLQTAPGRTRPESCCSKRKSQRSVSISVLWVSSALNEDTTLCLFMCSYATHWPTREGWKCE